MGQEIFTTAVAAGANHRTMPGVNTPSPTDKAAPAVAPVTHYENFPVASWLCPPHLRAPIAAIYHFARSADDIADEGEASAAQRLQELQAYSADLMQLGTAQEAQMLAHTRWPAIFAPLAAQVRAHQLPLKLLNDLLSAFMQDVQKTDDATSYPDMAAVLDYCSRSANPVGRLLLHLYGVNDAQALKRSDAICSALQLINFWQDLSVDLPRARHYVPDAELSRHGLNRSQLLAQPAALTPALRTLLAELAADARARMNAGSPLVHQLPGRAGWELRLVVQGGLKILDKVDTLNGANLSQRVTVGKLDSPSLLLRTLKM